MQKYNVLIIGAGNIGAFYDKPAGRVILTHAHAFSKHSGFHLIGFVDVDSHQGTKAARIWHTEFYPDLKTAFKKHRIDVVCEAVPDEYHYQVLKQISKYPVKFVIAEKPLTIKIRDAKKIVKIYQKQNIPVLINYTRRFVPEFQKLKSNIEKNQFGKYLSGIGYYGKGLKHNGSHMIDLVRLLISEVESSDFLGSENDFFADDESVSAVLHLKNEHDLLLQHINCQKYTIFELDLFFEKKRIRIINSGSLIEEYHVVPDKKYHGYQTLVKTKTIRTSINRACYFCADNVYRFLTKKKTLLSPIDEGLKTLVSCEKISHE